LLTFEAWDPFPFEAITPAKGEVMSEWVRFTAARYGPVFAVAAWRPDCSEPIYLVSNLHDEEAVLQTYRKRGRIEMVQLQMTNSAGAVTDGWCSPGDEDPSRDRFQTIGRRPVRGCSALARASFPTLKCNIEKCYG
jgi:hypothetical protein